MAAVGQRFSEYVTMGGGSRSRLWCAEIIADVTGVPVLRSTSTEATCSGPRASWRPQLWAGTQTCAPPPPTPRTA
jgi:xylulokinase